MSRALCTIAVVVAAGFGACARTEVVQGFPDSFVGVGLELTIKEGRPTVVRTLPNGPAALAGVQASDLLLLIDGKETRGLSLGDVVMKLRGAPESQTTLTLERAGARFIVVVRRTAMKKADDDYQPAP